MNARRIFLSGSVLAAAALALSFGAPPASAQNKDALILLGKNIFFDKQLSTPRGKQACASCHDPRVGWTLPLSNINETTVGAPGAQPGALGGRKPQNNSYVQGFLGEYRPGAFGPITRGGAFWDGRAEGCGASTNDPNCQAGDGNVSETITPDDVGGIHTEFLGAVADQALNPTARPGVEQNTREKSVCQMVKTAKYNRDGLFEQAWGAPIDCNQQGDPPAYHISFKQIAVAVAAWQGSPDVNSFSSRRDRCIRGNEDADHKFPCDNMTETENEGHDLFYGVTSNLNPEGKNALCAGCHNNFLPANAADGDEPNQIYTDMAYHSIALPFNRELSRADEDTGLFAHDDLPGNIAGLGDEGLFKTPPLRNVTKNQLNITKAFMHNGYFKRIEDVVHYYNTRFDGTGAPTDADPANNVKTVCDDPPVNIPDATAEEAIANNCWPAPEFPGTAGALGGLLGNLGLDADQEAALVAYIRTLDDSSTPTAPPTVK
jgi:cytochrome c peroxidase